eukprot:TRINITY_DN2986_c1_g2_i1.p1 TRINITY_DN2986_c1_g2~~TRINITY_DN2986_c1_g2_i1.p1  ORF type:complete len:415 (+),score=99.92 TRINITY_DN2986_c1_g2_i1:166-1245(+)
MATRILNPLAALQHDARVKISTLLQMFHCLDLRTVEDALVQSDGDFHRALELLLTLVCVSQSHTDLCPGPHMPTLSKVQNALCNDWDRDMMQAGNSPRLEDSIEGPSTFPELPNELFIEIMSYVPKRSLCTLRQLSRRWCELIDMDLIWKDKLLYYYGLRDQGMSEFATWKARFIDADRLRWSSVRKSHKLELSNNGRTARDLSAGNEKYRWVTALTDNVFAAGQHYIEIVVDRCCDDSKNSIKVGFGCVDGVSNTKLTYNCPFGYSGGSYATQDHTSWVYLADGRIMAHNTYTGYNGNCWSKNDRIGVLIDFFDRSIAFFWNSRRQHKPLPLDDCTSLHVAVSLIGNNQVTLTNGALS